MNSVIKKIREELKASADERVKISTQRFFKEEIKVYGLKSAAVTKIAKTHFSQIKNLDKKEIFSLCEELFQSGYLEEFGIAATWSYKISDRFLPTDFKIFEQWIKKYIDNWAKCDTLCNHTVGTFIEQNPSFVDELKRWTKSKNRWVKRAAAVSLIVPAKKGKFLNDIFEIAESLLIDKDDMVQKGYGWMLKEASRKNQKEVFEFVMKNKKVMPRTALRYAIEKMPESLRRRAMIINHQ
ncbi:MAG: DNA alkylation repair protein [Planctomycetes bacterium GWF2_41_51]|nr:MAG: DNA alkylation repair protein [Planctomycetes bacterium GWF2_41_51]HBG28394.1 DNA alkylation repair protein [Phycisphaerales bacterium]